MRGDDGRYTELASFDILGLPGVYGITNKYNGRIYIGSSYNCRKRLLGHLSTLKRGKHANPILQNSYNIHGEDGFAVGVIEYCDKGDTITKEQEHIDKNIGNLYNITREAVTCGKSRKMTPEQIEKIRIANTGKKYPNKKRFIHSNRTPGLDRICIYCGTGFRTKPSIEKRIRGGKALFCPGMCGVAYRELLSTISRSVVGRTKPILGTDTKFKKGHNTKHSEETKRKIGEANKGKKPWTYGRFGENSPRFGTKASEETKAKMREAHKGHHRGGWKLTEETRKRMSDAKRGVNPK